MKIKRSMSVIKRSEQHPWREIATGLLKAGYERTSVQREADLLITWTPWKNSIAEKLGKSLNDRWLVFENGYIPAINGQKYYSVGLSGYNGTEKQIPQLGRDLSIKFKPWRKNGEYILVVGQFGHRDIRYSMPLNWPEGILKKLRALTDRKIVYRPKPIGRQRPLPTDIINNMMVDNTTDLDTQLRDAYCVVTWNSPSISVQTLQRGVPVFIDSTTCIAKEYSGMIDDIETPFYAPNMDELSIKLSNSMWSASEVVSGEVFRQLERHLY